MSKPIVIALGEILWDMLPTGKRAGGAPVNFAYHASQNGAESYAISAVGNDELGAELLNDAHKAGINTLVQESGLDDAGRAAFLGRFSPRPEKTLLGFGVMGGIFGEGVDLTGDRLIGCAIVGVGLPQVSPRQEMLRRYYDAQNGAGFDYAYRWPGMNKVLQAAGRVIRTQEDKGVVLLLDDRFAQSEYARLFPKHWRHLEYLRDTEELKKKLEDFWAE